MGKPWLKGSRGVARCEKLSMPHVGRLTKVRGLVLEAVGHRKGRRRGTSASSNLLEVSCRNECWCGMGASSNLLGVSCRKGHQHDAGASSNLLGASCRKGCQCSTGASNSLLEASCWSSRVHWSCSLIQVAEGVNPQSRVAAHVIKSD